MRCCTIEDGEEASFRWWLRYGDIWFTGEWNMMKNKIVCAAITSVVTLGLFVGCSNKADMVSENISKAADNFEIARRIVFVNGITDKYLLSIEGRCNINVDQDQRQLEVTCRTKDGDKKHYLGLSDNVTYFVEQMNPAQVNENHYRVFFRPETIIPDIDAQP